MRHQLSQLVILAQSGATHRTASFFEWYWNHMGFLWGLGIPLVSGAICLVGGILLVTAKNRWVFILVMLTSLLPLLLGLLGTVQGMINAFQIISMSSAQPRSEELSLGINTALVTTFVGAALCLPPLLVAGVGFFAKGPRRA